MKNQILAEFDKSDIGGFTFFFHPDHGCCYIANSRICLFADVERWAVVIEKNGYGNRGMTIGIELNYFGNCLWKLDRAGYGDQFVCNIKYFNLFDEESICVNEPQEGFELLDP